MKKIKNILALFIIMALMTSVSTPALYAAEGEYHTELSAAIAFAELLEKGEASMTIGLSSSRFDFALCYRYLSMLYRDAYVFEYIPSPRNALIRVSYNDAEKHAQAEAEAEAVVARLINDGMGDYEKYYALYSYIRDNCQYDMHAALNQANETGDAFSAYGALVNKKAVCDGLSSAYAMLCRHAGLPCVYVGSNEMNHSWNAVLYNGAVMYLDVTYDITSGTEVNYFMLDEASMSVDHTWDKNTVLNLTNEIWDDGFVSAYTLNRLGGLFRGSDKGFELDRTPNRVEAAIMLVRFLGLESYAYESFEALEEGEEPYPFKDINPNHAPYIALLYQMGLTNGTSADAFSPDDEVTLKDYMTFMLRALGYSEETDFSWETAPEDALGIGILSQQQYDRLCSQGFDRGSMAYAALAVLEAPTAEGELLYERLVADGVLNEKSVKDFILNY